MFKDFMKLHYNFLTFPENAVPGWFLGGSYEAKFVIPFSDGSRHLALKSSLKSHQMATFSLKMSIKRIILMRKVFDD